MNKYVADCSFKHLQHIVIQLKYGSGYCLEKLKCLLTVPSIQNSSTEFFIIQLRKFGATLVLIVLNGSSW